MWEVSERIEINAPAESVWKVIADIEGHAQLAGSGEVQAIRILGPLAAGTVFEGDIAVSTVGSFVSRNVLDVVDEPRELRWTSYPPLDDDETQDHQIEVRWSFVLTPTATGTTAEHSTFIPDPKLGAAELAAFVERTDRITTVREGMRATLANLKARAET